MNANLEKVLELARRMKTHAWLARFRDATTANNFARQSTEHAQQVAQYVDELLAAIQTLGEQTRGKMNVVDWVNATPAEIMPVLFLIAADGTLDRYIRTNDKLFSVCRGDAQTLRQFYYEQARAAGNLKLAIDSKGGRNG